MLVFWNNINYDVSGSWYQDHPDTEHLHSRNSTWIPEMLVWKVHLLSQHMASFWVAMLIFFWGGYDLWELYHKLPKPLKTHAVHDFPMFFPYVCSFFILEDIIATPNFDLTGSRFRWTNSNWFSVDDLSVVATGQEAREVFLFER